MYCINDTSDGRLKDERFYSLASVSPALHESLSLYFNTIKACIETIPEQASQLSAQKVKTIVLEFGDKVDKDKETNASFQKVNDPSPSSRYMAAL